MQVAKKYDYIIAGAGCAGYSLLYHLLKDPILSTKKILIVDANLKKGNDRTWCFWEDRIGPFESIVCKKWSKIEVVKGEMHRSLPTFPFEYKMIQGIDFYQFVAALAKTFDTVDWQEGHINAIESIGSNEASVVWEGGAAIGKYVFSSIPVKKELQIKSTLWQHFKGNVVEFEEPVFNDSIARLMDFNVPQMDGTGFMYLLPLSNTKALIEYTLFSPTICQSSAYDKVLQEYMEQHYQGLSYQIVHTEIGAIPMTANKFATNHASVIAIGTMGDAVKASTGYAFQFIQEQVQQIVFQLKQNHFLNASVHHTRHHFYDAVLLYILEHKKMAGADIFARIFKKNKAATVFKFLSNTSNLVEDISIMRSLPTSIFLPAALKVLFRRS